MKNGNKRGGGAGGVAGGMPGAAATAAGTGGAQGTVGGMGGGAGSGAGGVMGGMPGAAEKVAGMGGARGGAGSGASAGSADGVENAACTANTAEMPCGGGICGGVGGTVGVGGVNPAPGTADTTVRCAAEQLVMMPIDELIPYENNARVHSKDQIKLLRASLREFGFVTPILIDFDGNVIAGHGRLLAARAEGMGQVPCVLVTNLTEGQRKAYILADNRLSETAEWDKALLSTELSGLSALGFEVGLTGFSTVKDLEDLGFAPALEAERPRGKMRAPKTCTCPSCGCEFSPGEKKS